MKYSGEPLGKCRELGAKAGWLTVCLLPLGHDGAHEWDRPLLPDEIPPGFAWTGATR